MSSVLFNRRLLLASISCSTLIASGVHADPPALEAVIVQTNDGAPPGFPNAFWNVAQSFSNPVIDEAGKIAFVGTIFGDGITPANNRVQWHGEAGNWTVLARNGDPEPAGLPGLVFGPSGISGSNYPLNTPNGMVSVSGTMAGAGITTANDTAAWFGPANNLTLAIREGNVAPGTAGASFNSSMALSPVNGQRVNNAGQILIASNLTGGDTVTANNQGVFLAGPSGVTKVWRKGDPAPGAPALPDTSGPFINHSAFGLHLNGSGDVLMNGSLVAGTAGGVATTNDSVVFVVEAGIPRIVARESDPVPGMTDVIYKATGAFNLATRALNNNGKVLFNAQLDNANGGTSVTLANDMIWLVDDHGTMTVAVREGDAMAGGTFNLANFQNIMLNNNDRIAMAGTATNPLPTGIVSCLWEGPIGGPYTLIMQQGTPVPGLTDVNNAFSISSANIAYNNADQIVFSSNLSGPGVTVGVDDRAIFAWDATSGLQLIARTGVTQVQGLLDLAILSLIGGTGQNGECGSTILTDNGWLAFSAQDVKGYRALIRTNLTPAPACPADIDGNDSVDVNDLLAVISTWGACADPNNCPADIAPAGGDDVVDVNDLLAVITTWGACP